MRKGIFVRLVFISFFLFVATHGVYANNLVSNSSFEINDVSWKSNNSAVSFSYANDTANDGSQSAKIANPKTSSYGIEQVLTDISSSLNYQISAMVKQLPPYPDKVFLRVAWYKSTDASGSQSSTDDSVFAAASTDWQKLEFIKTPPDGINSAKLRLLVASGSAYFDNVQFTEYFAEAPTPTPRSTTETVSFPTISVSTPTPTVESESFERIYLSEIMANPQDDEQEWIELYNDNDFPVTLVNWYVDDAQNQGSAPKIFSLSIAAKNYATIDLSSSIFNNAGDTARILDFNQNQKDRIVYTDSQKGYSLGRKSFENQDICEQMPTKGSRNNPCLSPSPSTRPIIAPSPKKSVTVPTRTLYKTNPYISKNSVSTNRPAVLGETIENVDGNESNHTQDDKKKIRFFSTLSASYSLLTLASVLLKMKDIV